MESKLFPSRLLCQSKNDSELVATKHSVVSKLGVTQVCSVGYWLLDTASLATLIVFLCISGGSAVSRSLDLSTHCSAILL
jgi:hypothetical protein